MPPPLADVAGRLPLAVLSLLAPDKELDDAVEPPLQGAARVLDGAVLLLEELEALLAVSAPPPEELERVPVVLPSPLGVGASATTWTVKRKVALLRYSSRLHQTKKASGRCYWTV